MKMLTLSLLFSSWLVAPAFAAPLSWQDIEITDEVVLTQDIELNGSDGSVMEISAEERLRLEDLMPLDGISVVKAVFSFDGCPAVDFKTEMMIVLPKRGEMNSEVGVQIEKGCRFAVFIETKDYGTISFFESIAGESLAPLQVPGPGKN
jgi:hypothetical protein